MNLLIYLHLNNNFICNLNNLTDTKSIKSDSILIFSPGKKPNKIYEKNLNADKLSRNFKNLKSENNEKNPSLIVNPRDNEIIDSLSEISYLKLYWDLLDLKEKYFYIKIIYKFIKTKDMFYYIFFLCAISLYKSYFNSFF